jgi:hypothetical protein
MSEPKSRADYESTAMLKGSAILLVRLARSFHTMSRRQAMYLVDGGFSLGADILVSHNMVNLWRKFG